MSDSCRTDGHSQESPDPLALVTIPQPHPVAAVLSPWPKNTLLFRYWQPSDVAACGLCAMACTAGESIKRPGLMACVRSVPDDLKAEDAPLHRGGHATIFDPPGQAEDVQLGLDDDADVDSPSAPPREPAPRRRAGASTTHRERTRRIDGERTPAMKSKPSGFKISLVHHRDVAAAFGVSIPSLLRWVRSGQFPAPHSTLGTFLLFDRKLIEHRLEHGTWPAGTEFRGARNVRRANDAGDFA